MISDESVEDLKKAARVRHKARLSREIPELEQSLRRASWEIATQQGEVSTDTLTELHGLVAQELAARASGDIE